jgi:NAD(P)-dependent dehydrogenase (short-subunit alcohol dehydrogenase family)
MSRFNGRVAVVTGGANGLGEAIAPRLSEAGAAIAVLDRDERGHDVAEKLASGEAPGSIYGLTHPLNGSGTPDDIAWGVAYLASDHARWVTGAELVIDGDHTAR